MTIPSYVVVTYKGIDKLEQRVHGNNPIIDIRDGILYLKDETGQQTLYASMEWVSVEQRRENNGN